jgi:hypothetical protein
MNQAIHHSANDREARDLAGGAFALKVIGGTNLLFILTATVLSATSLKATAYEALAWIGTVEVFLTVVIYMPVFLFRRFIRRESVKLAAARAVTWLTDAFASI